MFLDPGALLDSVIQLEHALILFALFHLSQCLIEGKFEAIDALQNN